MKFKYYVAEYDHDIKVGTTVHDSEEEATWQIQKEARRQGSAVEWLSNRRARLVRKPYIMFYTACPAKDIGKPLLFLAASLLTAYLYSLWK